MKKTIVKVNRCDCEAYPFCEHASNAAPKTDTERLAQAVIDLLDCQNRYKDGLSDERWTDYEMAERKSKAREQGLKLLRELGLYPAGRII